MANKKYNVIDIFSGCGGLSLGLYEAGWKGVFAIEKDSLAFETLKYNLIENKKHFDWPAWLPIKNYDIDEILAKYENELKSLEGKIDLVAGGPPCQGFSMAGKRVESDIRNKLVFSYVKFIEIVRPKMIFFENVKGFTYAFCGNKQNSTAIPYSRIVLTQLERLGYNISAQVINVSNFGIPQRRERFILIGIRNDIGNSCEFIDKLNKNKSKFLKSKNLPDINTLEDAVSDLLRENGEVPSPDRKGFMSGLYGKCNSNYQKLLRGEKVEIGKVVDSHSFAKQSKEKIDCYKLLLREYPRKGIRIDGDKRKQWGIKQRGIFILNSKDISPTITGHPDDYLHYCEPRIMTVRECARIQSFPDWYEIKKKYTTGGKLRKCEVPRYSQVGNAIPPLFAEQVGLVLKEMIRNGIK